MTPACPDGELLDRYHGGDLSPEAAEDIRAHLEGCESCRDQTRECRADLALLDDMRVVLERESADPTRALFGSPEVRGARFGPYEIQDLLGVGGMSKVYRAVDTQTRRVVALKLLKGEHQSSAEIRRRFEREARAMAKLEHPNIVRIFDCISDHGRIALAMELVEGGSLADWLERHRRDQANPDPAEVLDLSLQAARGLGAAHAAGLIHRDIKPSNLLLGADGRAKISDFGVVQALESTTWVTGTGHQIGTPAYMSPEQCKGERASPASDIYSLGVTMFELATGRLPFVVEGGSPFAQMLRHISEPAPDPCGFNPRISPRLAVVMVRCLEKSPEDRYPNGDGLCVALETASRSGPKPPATPTARKTGWNINTAQVGRQLEALPLRAIVAWTCRLARRVQGLNPDTRVSRAIDLAEAVALSEDDAGQTPSTRILARMQRLRAASLAAAYADGDATEAAVAAARAAAATSSTAAARCATDAAADAVFALKSALIACRKGKMSATAFWREAQRDFRKLRHAELGAPGTVGSPLPPDFWDTHG